MKVLNDKNSTVDILINSTVKNLDNILDCIISFIYKDKICQINVIDSVNDKDEGHYSSLLSVKYYKSYDEYIKDNTTTYTIILDCMSYYNKNFLSDIFSSLNKNNIYINTLYYYNLTNDVSYKNSNVLVNIVKYNNILPEQNNKILSTLYVVKFIISDEITDIDNDSNYDKIDNEILSIVLNVQNDDIIDNYKTHCNNSTMNGNHSNNSTMNGNHSNNNIIEKTLINNTKSVYLLGENCLKWNHNDTNLGGSEQAVLNIANILNKTMNKNFISVYGYFNEYNDTYVNIESFNFKIKYDNIILWRMSGIVFYLQNKDKIKSNNIILDIHDNFSYTFNKLENNMITVLFSNVNHILLKSNYHVKSLKEFLDDKINSDYFSIISTKIRLIPNGVKVDKFSPQNNVQYKDKREPYRFCYCSSYDRGLIELLIYIWPTIYKIFPYAELHVYYGMDYIFDEDFKKKTRYLLGSPGVIDHGRQSEDMIIREKYLSTFHLFITDTVAEIDCINIRESLVAGCIPIISNVGVFAERDGVRVNDIKDYESIIKLIASLLIPNNKDKVVDIRNKLYESDKIISWECIVENLKKYLFV
jgi:hypothetical protein